MDSGSILNKIVTRFAMAYTPQSLPFFCWSDSIHLMVILFVVPTSINWAIHFWTCKFTLDIWALSYTFTVPLVVKLKFDNNTQWVPLPRGSKFKICTKGRVGVPKQGLCESKQDCSPPARGNCNLHMAWLASIILSFSHPDGTPPVPKTNF